jgi:vancomycin aglycone glucosyltransferase
MRVLLSKYGSRGDVQPLVGLAVQERALGAEAEEWDVPPATSVMLAGGWR